MSTFIKPEVIVRALLGLLEREMVLPALVWRDTGINFEGAKDDTVSLRVPAYTTARVRQLRSGTPVITDTLTELKQDVTLAADIYKGVTITDEELTLDIVNFGEQVLSPVVRSVARAVEDYVAFTFENGMQDVNLALDVDHPYNTIVDAREALNNANVPFGGRTLLVGSRFEALILKADNFVRVDWSGTSNALREATIGRIAGFDVVTSNAIAPDVGFAFHRTALILCTRAPVAPQGATWSAQDSFAGIAMRVLRDYDFTNTTDRLLADVYCGTRLVTDAGAFNHDGKFVPWEEPQEFEIGPGDPVDHVVRCVRISGLTS